MKKNDWIVLVVTGIYSFLFYKEALGLNLSLFTLVIIIGMVINNRDLVKQRNWMIMALSCIISAVSVSYVGNTLSFITNFISILVLIGMSNKASVCFSFVYGLYSFVCSPSFLIKEIANKEGKSINKRKILMILVSLVITFIFFLMYKSSNAIFGSFADKINLDWISWGWNFFTFFGFIFIFGFFNAKKIATLAQKDETDKLDINPDVKNEFLLRGKKIFVTDEYFSGKLLFILLNGLIAIVNLLDFNFLFFGGSLPKHLTFAQFLHQGVGMLVVSITISIIILLFYFRGELNFYTKSKSFRMLAYAWILQNLFMLVSVSSKNTMYIEQYGLTYKRIGIYIYVILTTMGLITTFVKIYKVKINIYLIRVNGWLFYSVLLISSMIDWDQAIIECDQKGHKEYDVYYLISLSDSNIPALTAFKDKIDNDRNKRIIECSLRLKTKQFSNTQKNKSWKSWNYKEAKTAEFIENNSLNKKHITSTTLN